jgi:hypothetical protein
VNPDLTAVVIPLIGYTVASAAAVAAFVVRIERRLSRMETKLRVLQLSIGGKAARAFEPTTDNAHL